MVYRIQDALERAQAHPLFQAYNPEGKRFVRAVWLSPDLSQLAQNGVQVAALVIDRFPHIKAIPAFCMMLDDLLNGRYEQKQVLVVPSSGNTAHAAARLAPAFGFMDVKVVLSSDVTKSKQDILSALSTVEVIEVPKGRSVAARAVEEGERAGHYLLNQYSHWANGKSHFDFTAPQVFAALEERGAPLCVAAAMGSGGTARGIAHFARSFVPSARVIGVHPVLGKQVPGSRDRLKMAEVVPPTIPWADEVFATLEVGRNEAFQGMRMLWSEVDPQPGPTSGLAWRGLEEHFHSLRDRRARRELQGKTVGFVCPDDGRFYSERITGELDGDQGVIT